MDARNGCGEGVEILRPVIVVYKESTLKGLSLRGFRNTFLCGTQTTCTPQQSSKHKGERMLEPFPIQGQMGEQQTQGGANARAISHLGPDVLQFYPDCKTASSHCSSSWVLVSLCTPGHSERTWKRQLSGIHSSWQSSVTWHRRWHLLLAGQLPSPFSWCPYHQSPLGNSLPEQCRRYCPTNQGTLFKCAKAKHVAILNPLLGS